MIGAFHLLLNITCNLTALCVFAFALFSFANRLDPSYVLGSSENWGLIHKSANVESVAIMALASRASLWLLDREFDELTISERIVYFRVSISPVFPAEFNGASPANLHGEARFLFPYLIIFALTAESTTPLSCMTTLCILDSSLSYSAMCLSVISNFIFRMQLNALSDATECLGPYSILAFGSDTMWQVHVTFWVERLANGDEGFDLQSQRRRRYGDHG